MSEASSVVVTITITTTPALDAARFIVGAGDTASLLAKAVRPKSWRKVKAKVAK